MGADVNVPEWENIFDIEEVLARCIGHLVKQIDADYVRRWSSNQPYPALQVPGDIQLEMALLRALPLDRRKRILDELREGIYRPVRDALTRKYPQLGTMRAARAYDNPVEGAFADAMADALFAHWLRIYTAIRVVLADGPYPDGNETFLRALQQRTEGDT